jgi:single-strand DNA-binding protein
MSLNRVVLIGRLTRDPELRQTTGGKQVASFAIAVDRRGRASDDQPNADFFNISAWDRTADFVGNYLKKGRLVAVEGRLQTRKYTASDGTNREVYEIVADNVQGLDRPKDDSGAPSGGGGGGYSSSKPAAPATADDYDPFADE